MEHSLIYVLGAIVILAIVLSAIGGIIMDRNARPKLPDCGFPDCEADCTGCGSFEKPYQTLPSRLETWVGNPGELSITSYGETFDVEKCSNNHFDCPGDCVTCEHLVKKPENSAMCYTEGCIGDCKECKKYVDIAALEETREMPKFCGGDGCNFICETCKKYTESPCKECEESLETCDTCPRTFGVGA